MTKHLEVKTYESYGISIMVEINYDQGQISLVERNSGKNCEDGCRLPFKHKEYVFVKRELEYMNGWQNVLKIK